MFVEMVDELAVASMSSSTLGTIRSAVGSPSAKESHHHVPPRAAGGREVRADARMAAEPALDL